MPISVECECGCQFQVADKAAGRRVRCRDCDEPIDVPKPSSRQRRPRVDADEFGSGEESFKASTKRHRVTMSASPAATACLTAEMIQQTCEELVEYLGASTDVFRKADLKLDLDIEVHTKLVVAVQVKANGTINGKPFRKSFEQIFEDYTEAANFAAGGVGQALVGKAVEKLISNLSKHPDAHGGLQQKFEKIKYELFDAFDRNVNRKASSAAGKWKTIFYSSFAAAPLFILIVIGIALSREGSIVPGIIFGVFAAIPAVLLVMAAGLVFMPDSFYEREAIGRRALKFTGVKSPAAGRVVAFITCLALIGCIGWVLYIVMTIDLK